MLPKGKSVTNTNNSFIYNSNAYSCNERSVNGRKVIKKNKSEGFFSNIISKIFDSSKSNQNIALESVTNTNNSFVYDSNTHLCNERSVNGRKVIKKNKSEGFFSKITSKIFRSSKSNQNIALEMEKINREITILENQISKIKEFIFANKELRELFIKELVKDGAYIAGQPPSSDYGLDPNNEGEALALLQIKKDRVENRMEDLILFFEAHPELKDCFESTLNELRCSKPKIDFHADDNNSSENEV